MQPSSRVGCPNLPRRSHSPLSVPRARFSLALNVSRATITNLINQAYDPSSIAANNLSEILLRLQAAKEIAEYEKDALRAALHVHQKPRNRHEPPLDLQQRKAFHSGAVWWSPCKLREARFRQLVKEKEKEKELLDKIELKEAKENNRIYQLKIKEAARAAREEAKKVRDEAKAVKAAELDAKRRDRDAAKAIQQPQSGKRKASKPAAKQQPKKRRVGGAGGGTLAEYEARKLRLSVHHLSVQYELLKHKNEGLKEALQHKKKHRKKGKALNLQQRQEYHGGSVFWSPRKLREARAREAVRERDETEEKLQKLRSKKQREEARLQRQDELEERRVERQRLKEMRELERAEKAAERARQKERDAAKAIQLPQKGKRRASAATSSNNKRQKRVEAARAVIRGRAAGNRRIPRSKVQRVAQLLPATPRNVLASPHFSYGSRQDPTQGQGKDIAAQNFTIWWESLGQETITVFSDGSEQQINGTRVVTYGYAIYQGQAAVATGQGSLNALSHVFDAEAIGACRGLKHALQLSLPSQREIVLCIDSTSVIWGIRGAAPASSQWAFLQIHGAMEAYSVKTRWAPGHMKIVGNELADQLADNEAKDPHQPYGMAASPTRSGIRTVGRRLLEHTRDTWWKDKSSRLSAWYTQWQLPYDTRRTPAALWLPRRILAKVLMIRSTHGDFEWYHRKFNHEDTSKCLCGRPKTPEHLVFCKRATTHFKKWPLRPIVPPRTRQEGLAYLAQLIDQPQEFETFVKVTNSFYDE
ncbi:DUF4670 multi-domain protein [Pyrenophora tritici-repentis]|nr:DUF4670 multi-domain protein [Pyrenophora tritici-repentis]